MRTGPVSNSAYISDLWHAADTRVSVPCQWRLPSIMSSCHHDMGQGVLVPSQWRLPSVMSSCHHNIMSTWYRSGGVSSVSVEITFCHVKGKVFYWNFSPIISLQCSWCCRKCIASWAALTRRKESCSGSQQERNIFCCYIIFDKRAVKGRWEKFRSEWLEFI